MSSEHSELIAMEKKETHGNTAFKTQFQARLMLKIYDISREAKDFIQADLDNIDELVISSRKSKENSLMLLMPHIQMADEIEKLSFNESGTGHRIVDKHNADQLNAFKIYAMWNENNRKIIADDRAKFNSIINDFNKQNTRNIDEYKRQNAILDNSDVFHDMLKMKKDSLNQSGYLCDCIVRSVKTEIVDNFDYVGAACYGKKIMNDRRLAFYETGNLAMNIISKQFNPERDLVNYAIAPCIMSSKTNNGRINSATPSNATVEYLAIRDVKESVYQERIELLEYDFIRDTIAKLYNDIAEKYTANKRVAFGVPVTKEEDQIIAFFEERAKYYDERWQIYKKDCYEAKGLQILDARCPVANYYDRAEQAVLRGPKNRFHEIVSKKIKKYLFKRAANAARNAPSYLWSSSEKIPLNEVADVSTRTYYCSFDNVLFQYEDKFVRLKELTFIRLDAQQMEEYGLGDQSLVYRNCGLYVPFLKTLARKIVPNYPRLRMGKKFFYIVDLVQFSRDYVRSYVRVMNYEKFLTTATFLKNNIRKAMVCMGGQKLYKKLCTQFNQGKRLNAKEEKYKSLFEEYFDGLQDDIPQHYSGIEWNYHIVGIDKKTEKTEEDILYHEKYIRDLSERLGLSMPRAKYNAERAKSRV